MTVSASYTPLVYAAAAGQTVFPYTWKILAASHLKCLINGVTKVYGVDYTVSGAGAVAGGNLTLIVACAAGDIVLLRRDTPLTQETDLASGEMYAEDELEAMSDKLTLIAQEHQGAVIPLSPAGYYLRINDSGTAIEAVAAPVAVAAAYPFDFGAAPPSSGTWSPPFIRFNSSPSLGGPMGWSLVTGGTPGIWAAWGFVSANPE